MGWGMALVRATNRVAGWPEASPEAARSRRVLVLLAAIVALSIADLDFTLTYSTQIGMVEINPIARRIMSMGSVWMLVLWKALTVGLAVGLLYHARLRWTAEAASWAGVAVLIWLTARWMTYNNEVHVMMCPTISQAVQSDARWVVLGQE